MKRLLGFILFLVIVYAAYLFFNGWNQKKHIFINETVDHSDDECIKLSITAAHMRVGVQNVVVITNNIPQNKSTQDFAVDVFRRLGLGRKQQGRAILFLFSPERHELKIEVAFALEEVLTDIIVKQMESAAKSYTFSNHNCDFWAEMINTMNIVVENKSNELTSYDMKNWNYTSGGAGVFNSNYNTSVEQLEKEFKKVKNNESEFQPQKSAEDTVKIYLRSLQLGIGDPNLPILSQASKLYRLRVPMNQAQMVRNSKMYEEALPFQIYEKGNRALILFKKHHPVLPIVLLKRSDNKFTINEPESWSHFHRFENSMDVFQKFPNHIFYSFLNVKNFVNPKYSIYYGAPPVKSFISVDDDFFKRLKSLQKALELKSSDATDFINLAEFYYFEAYWTEKAHEYYLKALKIQPELILYRWRLLDIYINWGKVTHYLNELRVIKNKFPNDKVLERDLEYYEKIYSFPNAEWQLTF